MQLLFYLTTGLDSADRPGASAKGATKLPRGAGRSGAAGGAETPPHLGPARRRPAHARPPRARARTPRARPARPPPRSSTGWRGADGRPRRAAPLAAWRGQREAAGGGGQARSPSASCGRAVREVRSAVTAAGRRGAPRERVTRAAVSRAPRRPPRETHAGTRAPPPGPAVRSPQQPSGDPQRPLPPAPAQGGPWALRGGGLGGPRASPRARGKEGGRQGGGYRLGVREERICCFPLKTEEGAPVS